MIDIKELKEVLGNLQPNKFVPLHRILKAFDIIGEIETEQSKPSKDTETLKKIYSRCDEFYNGGLSADEAMDYINDIRFKPEDYEGTTILMNKGGSSMEQIKKETKKRALQRIDTLIKTFKELQRRVESEDYEGTTILMLESQRYIGLVLGEVRNLITIKQNQKTVNVVDYKKGR